jgi:hypothetical protein
VSGFVVALVPLEALTLGSWLVEVDGRQGAPNFPIAAKAGTASVTIEFVTGFAATHAQGNVSVQVPVAADHTTNVDLRPLALFAAHAP